MAIARRGRGLGASDVGSLFTRIVSILEVDARVGPNATFEERKLLAAPPREPAR